MIFAGLLIVAFMIFLVVLLLCVLSSDFGRLNKNIVALRDELAQTRRDEAMKIATKRGFQ